VAPLTQNAEILWIMAGDRSGIRGRAPSPGPRLVTIRGIPGVREC
jgi:hypothetical protein